MRAVSDSGSKNWNLSFLARNNSDLAEHHDKTNDRRRYLYRYDGSHPGARQCLEDGRSQDYGPKRYLYRGYDTNHPQVGGGAGSTRHNVTRSRFN